MGLVPSDSFDLQLAADEILTNIASYAYGPDGGHITIEIIGDEKRVTIIFTDSGRPFDPKSLSSPDISSGLMDRKIGGLGIYLARQLTDTLSYSREGDKNILIMEKRVNRQESESIPSDRAD